ncbi:hypothetical protein [Stutzerimonas azotifigens]|uniref:hypothetical protein n=1 Tax=Stutzerimonas azotifigens TaxID=291995 RepID=UPI000413C729|nr:hypothetical protein [Stutzerimonas azotifigens]
MSQILIAAFDRYDDAEQAKHDLLDAGIPADDVRLSASSNPKTIMASRVDAAAESRDSVSQLVSDFFHSVFGSEHTRHARDFPEAMRRGSTIVTVTLPDEADADPVEEVLQRHGAIDIDERSANWKAGDARPLTASTEALTTGYPEATESSTGLSEADDTSLGDLRAGEGAIPGRAANDRAGRRDSRVHRVHIVTH